MEIHKSHVPVTTNQIAMFDSPLVLPCHPTSHPRPPNAAAPSAAAPPPPRKAELPRGARSPEGRCPWPPWPPGGRAVEQGLIDVLNGLT